MKKSALNVFANAARAGKLDRSELEEDTILFSYRDECPRDLAVSLTMPIRPDQYDAMTGLLPIFDMNLPEGGLKERLRNQFAKTIAEFDDLDLLAIIGSSQIGRLRYSHEETVRQTIPTQSLEEILSYRGTADLFSALLERFAQYSGISGAQPKVLVRDEKAPQKLTHRGATHIVKAFDASEYPELAANEFICTRGAAAAGIVTQRVQLSENRKLLIAERFDLKADGDYLGMEDFCVLNARRAHGRYDGSYEGIARRISDFVSPGSLAEARDQFALLVAFACAIENGDAHLKNFAVAYETPESEVRLAPAYDIVATTPYVPRDTLALTLNSSKAFPERDPLIRFMRGVTSKSRRAVAEMLERVAYGVSVSIAQAQVYGRRYADARPFSDRLVEVMKRGLHRLGLSPVPVRA